MAGNAVLWTIIYQTLCSESKAGKYRLVEHVMLFLLNLLDEQHYFDVLYHLSILSLICAFL